MPFQSNFKANNTTSQKLQLTSEDLDRGSITKDFVIPHQSLRDCERFKEWEGENLTTLYQLNKQTGRIEAVNIQNVLVESTLLAEIKTDKKENKTRILKSWTHLDKEITKQEVRIISFATIDIINRKDTSRNPLIYQALDKLINDYQKYKDNFPQDYYAEFGRYMVESEMQAQNGILPTKILKSLSSCCSLVAKSVIFGDKDYNDGGVAIFHLYENYVPKFEGDENGLDKVEHFLFSALVSFVGGIAKANLASIGNEILDWLKQKMGGDGTGFDFGDIKANNAGIAYGVELRMRIVNGAFE